MTTHSDIVKITKKLKEAPGKLQRALVIEATRRIVLRTPVKTGRARGNWQVTSGVPANGAVEALDPTGSFALHDATTIPITGEDPVYIVNNLPYIDRLEHGSSTQ